MKDIIPWLDCWQKENEEIALATVVRVRGSAPRPAGARMCVTRSGKMAGSVSGGCVEGDVVERARNVLERGLPEIARYGIADELGLGVGLSCGGEIDVLIEPFLATEAWCAWRAAFEERRPGALAVAISPPSLAGRDLFVRDDGATRGSIAADLDTQVEKEATRMLGASDARVFTLRRRGHVAEIFVQTLAPVPRLYIVGATHAAVCLCGMARDLGFHVTVIDARATFATRERFPAADDLLVAWPHEFLETVPLDEQTYLVTLTHDPKFDIPTLARVLRSQARYVGAIGSRGTHERRKARLRELGFTDSELARIHSPVGLDIGGHTPEETALSILAEIVAVRHGRQGGPLKHRQKAIHED